LLTFPFGYRYKFEDVMRKRFCYLFAVIFLSSLLATSCQRSPGEVVEDSKTAARYAGKGFKSLGGKHGDSRQVVSQESYVGPVDEEYIPLNDEDLYRQLTLGESSALNKVSQDTAIPQSKERPGEQGSSIPGIDGFRTPSPQLANIFRPIYYDTSDYILRGQENLQALDAIADYLTKNPKVYIFIEGHCDERGAAAFNMALGARRGNSVRNLLIKQGVDLNRIFTISYGKERPTAFGHFPGAWRQNRRAVFKIFEAM
jgi:peptidoglycan-associated lipoprotein